MRFAGRLVAALALLLLSDAAWAAPACRTDPDVAASLGRITQVMANGRFVAYEPTSLQVINGRSTQADPASIARDLAVLRPDFDGLITYGALDGAEMIPDIAAKQGFRAVILGVWDITSAQEIANAVAAWKRHPDIVAGLSVGNEIVFGGRGSFVQIEAAIAAVRKQASGLAITTTEPFHLLTTPDAAGLLPQEDFMLANVHPVFQPWFRTAPDSAAATFVVNVVNDLAAAYCGPVLVKETGVPTAPAEAGYTPERQASFYKALRGVFPPSARRAFAYFSAFDAPWRANDTSPVPGSHPEEAHWGLYDENRAPKPAARDIPALPAP